MQITSNTAAFIEAQQYSQFILQNLHDGLLPDNWTRDVSDFGSGTTLNIKTVGSATIQDVQEDTPLSYQAIDTGTVTLSITDYIGDAWYISDVLRMDGSQLDQMQSMRAMESTRALQERVETRFLNVCNSSQTASALNNVNGFKHRFVASGTGQIVALDDFRDMKLSFDKANVPQAGRIAIVDPVVEATLNGLFSTTTSIDNNIHFEGMVNEGFAQEHKFVAHIFGWDIWTSNRLVRSITETIDSVTVTGGVANVFMSVLDDQTKPIMRAWRQQPKVETERNMKNKRDEFDVTSRFGFGAQRLDTLGILLTDDTTY